MVNYLKIEINKVKVYFKHLLFSLFFLCMIVNQAIGLTIPVKPTNYINDYANVLSPTTTQSLDVRLQRFEQQTSNQIAVAIFPSLENEDLENFTIALEKQWKIGQKNKDNGILLVIFIKEHKMRIEVGYGLEESISDALAGNIIDTNIAPYFKQGNYDTGVIRGVNALMEASAGLVESTKLSSMPTTNNKPNVHFSQRYKIGVRQYTYLVVDIALIIFVVLSGLVIAL